MFIPFHFFFLSGVFLEVNNVHKTNTFPDGVRPHRRLWPSWLRRQTQVLVLSEGVGSNPTGRTLFWIKATTGRTLFWDQSNKASGTSPPAHRLLLIASSLESCCVFRCVGNSIKKKLPAVRSNPTSISSTAVGWMRKTGITQAKKEEASWSEPNVVLGQGPLGPWTPNTA